MQTCAKVDDWQLESELVPLKVFHGQIERSISFERISSVVCLRVAKWSYSYQELNSTDFIIKALYKWRLSVYNYIYMAFTSA